MYYWHGIVENYYSSGLKFTRMASGVYRGDLPTMFGGPM
ncbi:hypothetical protein FRUB_00470 [Fimbriiglobus ruber]|uniref:Uncharacterized protein n=1 Tax=Fimbriiglobus ruber TaxID=1908690 RepID=A0A225DZJ6_9BACT|nr:hypothetical protein FRUB_00470 [Fimbriiglobus ruber]